MRLKLGLTLAVLAIGAGCGGDDDGNLQNPPTTGSIAVSTTTTGVDLDDSYELYFGFTVVGTIGANAQVVVPDQVPFDYAVGLDDIAGNCAVTGDNPIDPVTVVAGQTTSVRFEVACATANVPPTANAGPDQTVTDTDANGGEDVTLDGTGSTDGDGMISDYSWTENGTEIANGAMPTATFAVGTHVVTLTVRDDDGATDTDEVTITVEPAP